MSKYKWYDDAVCCCFWMNLQESDSQLNEEVRAEIAPNHVTICLSGSSHVFTFWKM